MGGRSTRPTQSSYKSIVWMSIVRRCINLPHCSRPYSQQKCSGNLNFGLKPAVTTIAPPAPEEAPSPLFCSPPVERSLREPEIRN